MVATMEMMKYLGIDYGDIRIGIAVSDEERKIAFPLLQISNDGFGMIAREIKKIIKKEKIAKIVIGLPISLRGQETAQTIKTKNFAKKLKKTVSVPVEFENEMLTTKIAGENSSKKSIDSSAAAIILQSYLDKMNH